MDEKYEVECPYCGEKKRIKKIVAERTFDEVLYKNKCMKCGKTFV